MKTKIKKACSEKKYVKQAKVFLLLRSKEGFNDIIDHPRVFF